MQYRRTVERISEDGGVVMKDPDLFTDEECRYFIVESGENADKGMEYLNGLEIETENGKRYRKQDAVFFCEVISCK